MDWIQILGGVILSIGGLFQIEKIIRVKETRDFSLIWVWLALIGILLMEVYALYLYIDLSTWGFLVSNSVSLGLQIFLLVLVYKYKEG